MSIKIISSGRLIFFIILLTVFIIIIGCNRNKDIINSQEDAIEPIYGKITVVQADSLIKANENNSNFIIIDVRTQEEYSTGHIENAININFNSPSFRNDINVLDKDNVYLIYCRSGGRSAGAFDVMKELEFQEVYELLGGIISWIDEGFPVVT
jgi:rhodanese-related sulfurtransferase